ncbi:hypothetical protein VVR26_10340 [Corynebacterium camporealensis]|uniref:hypothetical protein n=1 Tax=Corynebacterium camporealensis TaxID=161896 RepID=UPI0034CFFA74
MWSRFSLRWGLPAVLSASLLSSTVAVASPPEQTAETRQETCQVELNPQEQQSYQDAATEIYHLAAERKDALAEFEVLQPADLDSAFSFYFDAPTADFPWQPREVAVDKGQGVVTERAILTYLRHLSEDYAYVVDAAQTGVLAERTATVPIEGAFPEQFPAYQHALERSAELSNRVTAPCVEAAAEETAAGEAETDDHGMPAGITAALATATAMLLGVTVSGWTSVDWAEILSTIGRLV